MQTLKQMGMWKELKPGKLIAVILKVIPLLCTVRVAAETEPNAA